MLEVLVILHKLVKGDRDKTVDVYPRIEHIFPGCQQRPVIHTYIIMDMTVVILGFGLYVCEIYILSTISSYLTRVTAQKL